MTCHYSVPFWRLFTVVCVGLLLLPLQEARGTSLAAAMRSSSGSAVVLSVARRLMQADIFRSASPVPVGCPNQNSPRVLLGL